MAEPANAIIMSALMVRDAGNAITMDLFVGLEKDLPQVRT